jgi:hypothetical protein
MDTSNLYYGDEEFGDLVDWEDEPMTPEEELEAEIAYRKSVELEAYADFLDAPNCFD